VSTALSDLILAAQQRCDRVNATSITTEEWTSMVNTAAGELYGLLTETYEDYNVAQFQFDLPGGCYGNKLQVGFGTPVPQFDKIRKLSRQVAPFGSDISWAPCLRARSLLEFDLYTSPAMNPYVGGVQCEYALYGNTLELRPASSSAGTYMLWYIPSFQPLVYPYDTIDGTWMTTNGIAQYIILGAAAEALIKEESLDTANLLIQRQQMIAARVLKQFAPRDDNQPGQIADVKRVRAGFGFGPGGFGGGGW
jgi:hypothetical protein